MAILDERIRGMPTAEFQNRGQEKGRTDRQDKILTLTAALAEEV
jgi:hypothetical protein